LTTSWSALLHGNLPFAFHAHPLGPFLYLGFTYGAFLCLYGFISRKRLILNSIEMSRILAAAAITFLAFGLIRMATTPHFRTAEEQTIVSGMALR
jgi:hypothetical protein